MTRQNGLFSTNDINLRLKKRQIFSLIMTYFLLPQILYAIFFGIIYALNIGFLDNYIYVVDIGVTFTTISLMLFIIRKDIPNILQGFKDIKIYPLALKLYLLIIAFNIVMGLFINEQGANQEVINEMIKDSPLTQFISVVIFAPIMEEIVFRFAIFKSILNKNKKILAYIVSSLIFGSLHLVASVFEGTLYQDITLLPVYAILGAIFAFAYEHTGKLSAPIMLHMLNNFVAFLPMLLL